MQHQYVYLSFPAWKSHFFLHIVFLYFRLVWPCHSIRNYLVNGTIFKNMYFDRSYKFICKYFHFVMNQWDIMTKLRRSSHKVPSIPVHFNKTLNSSNRWIKELNIKFRENPSSGCRVIPCGRTDRHDEAACRFSQLWRLA